MARKKVKLRLKPLETPPQRAFEILQNRLYRPYRPTMCNGAISTNQKAVSLVQAEWLKSWKDGTNRSIQPNLNIRYGSKTDLLATGRVMQQSGVIGQQA